MSRLSGVIAAAATPLQENLSIDHRRLVQHCKWLLGPGGCDGVNLLGTTGEATSFSVDQRIAAMTAIAEGGLALDRFMVGTGANALSDAVRLTSAAKELGYAGALLLPPSYYKDIDADSLVDYVEAVIAGAGEGARIYLYHIPQNTLVPFTHEVVERLIRRNPGVVIGLKDSSGDVAYATEIARRLPELDVFPSSEGTLVKAAEAHFAGCISATVNVNGSLAQRAWRAQDSDQGRIAAAEAMAIRSALSKFPLVAAVKWALAQIHDDAAWTKMHPPLRALTSDEGTALASLLKATPFEGVVH